MQKPTANLSTKTPEIDYNTEGRFDACTIQRSANFRFLTFKFNLRQMNEKEKEKLLNFYV